MSIVSEMNRPIPGSPVSPASRLAMLRDLLAMLCVLAGLTLLTIAAWRHDDLLGMAALGASLLVVGLLLGLTS